MKKNVLSISLTDLENLNSPLGDENTSTYFKEKFERLSIRKPRKKALVAISRKIAVVIYNVLSKNQPYNPEFLKVFKKETVKKQIQYHKKQLEKLEKTLA